LSILTASTLGNEISVGRGQRAERNFVYFDSTTTYPAEHVMASGRLPRALPPSKSTASVIGRRPYLKYPCNGCWTALRVRNAGFPSDLWSAREIFPQDGRSRNATKEIQYSSRTEPNTDQFKRGTADKRCFIASPEQVAVDDGAVKAAAVEALLPGLSFVLPDVRLSARASRNPQSRRFSLKKPREGRTGRGSHDCLGSSSGSKSLSRLKSTAGC